MNQNSLFGIIIVLLLIIFFMGTHIGKKNTEVKNYITSVENQEKEIRQKDFVIHALSEKNSLIEKRDTVILKEIKSIQNNYKTIYEKIDTANIPELYYILDSLLWRHRFIPFKASS